MLYSGTGQRRLDEHELRWLPGYHGAAPVRTCAATRGSAAYVTTRD
jgi:hypothetical protein